MDCNDWNRKKVTIHHQELFNYELNCMYFVSSCNFLVDDSDDLSSPVRDKESEL